MAKKEKQDGDAAFGNPLARKDIEDGYVKLFRLMGELTVNFQKQAMVNDYTTVSASQLKEMRNVLWETYLLSRSDEGLNKRIIEIIGE